MQWIIYKHTLIAKCEHFGWSYIGQTSKSDPNERWRKDGTGYLGHTRTGQLLVFAKAIEKYGWENFSHEIIEDGIDTLEEAYSREQYWIAYYHTYVNDPECAGYNMTKGGPGWLGCKLSNETKLRIKRGLHESFPDGRCGENHPFYGKSHTKETKQKISKSKRENPSRYWLGKNRSEETKEKIRQTSTGRRLTQEQKIVYAQKKRETKAKNGTDKLSWVGVQQLSLDGKLIHEWPKLTDACEALGLHASNVVKVCRGERKSTGGFRWQYTSIEHIKQIQAVGEN